MSKKKINIDEFIEGIHRLVGDAIDAEIPAALIVGNLEFIKQELVDLVLHLDMGDEDGAEPTPSKGDGENVIPKDTKDTKEYGIAGKSQTDYIG